MNQYRIPPASYKRFQSLPSKEAKDEFFSTYREWVNHPNTKDLIAHIEELLEREIVESEKETKFITRFQFRFNEALSRGKRTLARKLIKDIKG